jgi:hypothetical protein
MKMFSLCLAGKAKRHAGSTRNTQTAAEVWWISVRQDEENLEFDFINLLRREKKMKCSFGGIY